MIHSRRASSERPDELPSRPTAMEIRQAKSHSFRFIPSAAALAEAHAPCLSYGGRCFIGYSGSRQLSASGDFEKEPVPALGLVNPVLDQAGRSVVPVS